MSIVALIVVLVLTIFLQQWLHRHIQGFVVMLTGNSGWAIKLLFYLLLPGILLHELSHYVVAKILLVNTSGIHLGVKPMKSKGNQISLGSVVIERTDPLRESLIGIAPFVVGIGAIWAIAGWGFDVWPETGLTVPQMFYRVADYASDWTTWLDLYLIFAVSTAMIPSQSDREPWGPVITVLGLSAVVFALLGWTPRVPADLVQFARQMVSGLTLALGVAVAVNGVVAFTLWILERVVERFSGKRMEFRVSRRR
ncbi:MAG: hypothetical protein HY868_02100 [Chloroflexi bacterium]|nr:hypothetical protein [Chloroflexota bacterium]